jgi:hypothetical protein
MICLSAINGDDGGTWDSGGDGETGADCTASAAGRVASMIDCATVLGARGGKYCGPIKSPASATAAKLPNIAGRHQR